MRQLNRTHPGHGQNQLDYLSELGYLSGLPPADERAKLALWVPGARDHLDDRARAYLDVNCGSCHRPEGSGNTSGLFLHAHQPVNSTYGLGKAPIAAGRGSGGFKFDISPGKPEESILVFRMKSLDPGIMMPEMGRKMVHEEGVALIEDWIRSL